VSYPKTEQGAAQGKGSRVCIVSNVRKRRRLQRPVCDIRPTAHADSSHSARTNGARTLYATRRSNDGGCPGCLRHRIGEPQARKLHEPTIAFRCMDWEPHPDPPIVSGVQLRVPEAGEADRRPGRV
jgi:hypothetical protein